MTIDNCVIDMDWRGITIHVAYVIRKEKNKYLLDVISPYEAGVCLMSLSKSSTTESVRL